ncbi:extracellular solute-binding protein [Paenibacillus alkaliterrae]|uniref:extracellular solute-binding protein n=1 Tax=Paenibacillus alkaliterrae TaxID=320909 RepID=UPI002E21CF07
MNRKPSILFKLTILVLMIVLTACGNSPSGDGGASHESANAGDRGTITMMANLHTPEVPSKKIEQWLEEKIGSDLDIQWIPDGSYEEKFNASMATETLPEAVYLKNADMLNRLRGQIRNGMFWEIGPMLGDFPHLQKLKLEVLQNTSVDGKIYGLYQERPLSRQGLIYRKDWADRLGLEAPQTIEKLYHMLHQFTFGDPDGNGLQDTFGLADRSDLVYGSFKTVASYFGTPNGWGEEGGKLLPEFMFQEYMDTMNFFRKLHQEGLMNRDFPVTSKADQLDLFISGKAGLYVGAMGDVYNLQFKAREVNPDAIFDVHNRIAGPKGERVWASSGFGTVVLFPTTSVQTEEELREILSFFDKLMEPEFANLLRWGIEGEHYNIEDGKVVPTADINRTNKEVKPYQAIEIGGPLTIKGYLDSNFQMGVKDKAETLTRDNDSILVHDPTWPLESNTFNERGARLQQYIQDATYQYILGLIDEAGFQAEVKRWLREGGQDIIEEFNT